MATIRVHKRGKFAQIPNETLQDPSIRNAARGLLAAMLSYPDDWGFNMTHLRAVTGETEHALRVQMQALMDAGYVKRWRVQRDWQYEVYESRAAAELATRDSTSEDSSSVNFTDVKSGGYIKTEESTNTYPSTKTNKTKDSEKPKAKAKKFDPLQVELPGNVPPDLWAEFVAHRSEIKKKLTPTATKQLLTRLQGFGAGAETALRDSIANGWTGVFPPKDKPGTKTVEDDAGILDQYKELGL